MIPRKSILRLDPSGQVISHEDYFKLMARRKIAGLWYRNAWLYPKLCRYLKGKALDVGCGIGDMVRLRPNTVGVDVNPKSVEFCANKGLEVVQMQPDVLPFESESFDSVNLDNVLEHLVDPTKLISEIHRVLRPGGVLLVGVPGKKGFKHDPDHKKFYTEGSLVNTINSSGFKLKNLFHQPFRSNILDAHFTYYTIYGAFQKIH